MRKPTRRRLSLRLATVAGIDIRVHITFAVLVALVALGSLDPDSPGLLASLVWLVALFACVIVHELAHGLVARRAHVPVAEIELLPIGGVSKMGRFPDDPAVELRIAAAGPAASVLVGVVVAAVALLADVTMWPPTLIGGAFLARLSWVNLLLAAFNLLPALPLDGGRVLRALLERRLGRARATHLAAGIGRVVAALMVVAGLVLTPWLVVIGAFVYVGTRAEEAVAAAHERIKRLRVGDVMIRNPITLESSAPAAGAAESLWLDPQRLFPVLGDDGRALGLVTTAALRGAGSDATVGELADMSAVVLTPEDDLESNGLATGELDAATVVSEGRVVGLVRAADVARAGQAPARG